VFDDDRARGTIFIAESVRFLLPDLYYARRPVVEVKESANIAPQTYEATLISGAGRL